MKVYFRDQVLLPFPFWQSVSVFKLPNVVSRVSARSAGASRRNSFRQSVTGTSGFMLEEDVMVL